MTAIDFLRAEYIKRRERNVRYSIRSFARDLGVSHSLISKIFSGQRRITAKQMILFASRLELDDQAVNHFVRDLTGRSGTESTPIKKFASLKLEYDQMVTRWYHQAILELTYTKNFTSSPAWIARRLGISTAEATSAVERLIALDLLEVVDGNWMKTNPMVRFESSRSLPAVRSYYRTMLKKADEELQRADDQAFHARRVAGGTIAIRGNRVSKAIQRLKEMQDQFVAEFADVAADDVYYLGLQFFSVLKPTQTN